MKNNNRKILQTVFFVGVLVSFVAFGLTGFMAVGGGLPFLPIIPWFFFAFFAILMVVVGSKGRSRHFEEDDYGNPRSTHKVNLRCPLCGALNDENARYCNQCGEKL
ncbi:MAG TPA: zinc ribbon domain-containing protein [Bacilli bacterium]|jgi:uncharacterized paraquat-inducible protein A|nr:MAG: hypothetical protein BWX94_00045 [Tenericutes bacterium ADurb.Bin140]HOE77117.1 zinc ribbon domain-containing protein [Bacilli bacterium]HON63724.1 zinc ribbon domain-containing protein [Bacilli bacterium]HOR95425.1 zinc ribbon domain-containing protein [Bacilli bacterium]HPK57947.1 zinc ribbon domain-containing protein [Bacilli bacterium]